MDIYNTISYDYYRFAFHDAERNIEQDRLFSGNRNRMLFLAAENWQNWSYDLSKDTPNTLFTLHPTAAGKNRSRDK